jgi:hypothetical protein
MQPHAIPCDPVHEHDRSIHTPQPTVSPRKTGRYWKRCKCRKALYVYEEGRDEVVSAKTRSWEQVEQFAQAERDRRDPVKQQLKEIEDQEAQKTELQKTKNITVVKAAERWLRSVKTKTTETAAIYIESTVAHQSVINQLIVVRREFEVAFQSQKCIGTHDGG